MQNGTDSLGLIPKSTIFFVLLKLQILRICLLSLALYFSLILVHEAF